MASEEKLNEWARKIYEVATEHGWHEEQHSNFHYLCLIMSEVAEMVEADRKRITDANLEGFRLLISKGHDFKSTYKDYIKGSRAEEMADVVIRILDMFNAFYEGSKLDMSKSFVRFSTSYTFPERAWYFTKEILGYSTKDIANSIAYMYKWAESLNIDLDTHIELKMKYNELRSYKHGGKKY